MVHAIGELQGRSTQALSPTSAYREISSDDFEPAVMCVALRFYSITRRAGRYLSSYLPPSVFHTNFKSFKTPRNATGKTPSCIPTPVRRPPGSPGKRTTNR